MAVSVGINAFDNLEEFAISVASNDVDGVSVPVNYGTFACSGFSISGCGEDNSKSSGVRPGEISRVGSSKPVYVPKDATHSTDFKVLFS